MRNIPQKYSDVRPAVAAIAEQTGVVAVFAVALAAKLEAALQAGVQPAQVTAVAAAVAAE